MRSSTKYLVASLVVIFALGILAIVSVPKNASQEKNQAGALEVLAQVTQVNLADNTLVIANAAGKSLPLKLTPQTKWLVSVNGQRTEVSISQAIGLLNENTDVRAAFEPSGDDFAATYVVIVQ